MTAKENALRIIRFDHPERVVGGPPSYGIHYQGCNHEAFVGGGHDCPVGTAWVDVWGTHWRKELDGVMGFPRVHPIADMANLKSYAWPDPNDERICGRVYAMAEKFPGGDLFLSGSHRETLWEKSYMLASMETMMVAFHAEPGFAREMLRRVMDFQLGIAAHYLKLGIAIAGLGDDLGTQRGPLLGPDIVEEFLVPEYERLFSLYRERGALIAFHSCGKIDWMLDTFMRLGVDILNPIQASANDLGGVRAVTQGRMALQGGISTKILMDGPPERIEDEVRRRIWQLGRDGGYFCSPDQGMPFPKAHSEALQQAVERFGKYPLAPPEAEQ